MLKITSRALLLVLALSLPGLMGADGCDSMTVAPTSTSGVRKATADVQTDGDGLTVEQRNITERLHRDNLPGSVKHLYMISATTGQVIFYSTVRGKVTSGAKRLSPSSVQTIGISTGISGGFDMRIGNSIQTTAEVLGDDGAYGSSGDYLYWFDAANRYHQQYTQSCSCIIHVSDQPIPIKSTVLRFEQD